MSASLSDEKYVSFTTYRHDGSAKAVPVWIADLGDGTMGFTTFSSSYKAKRLQKDPRVVLQPSDSRGNPVDGSSPSSGTATLHIGGADFERVLSQIKQKYGFQFTMITLFGKLQKLIGRHTGTDSAVIITLD